MGTVLERGDPACMSIILAFIWRDGGKNCEKSHEDYSPQFGRYSDSVRRE